MVAFPVRADSERNGHTRLARRSSRVSKKRRFESMKTAMRTFDALAASLKWREDIGRTLSAVMVTERIAFLVGLRASKSAASSASGVFALGLQGGNSGNPGGG